jgi:trk system potassium uptake protein TrkH
MQIKTIVHILGLLLVLLSLTLVPPILVEYAYGDGSYLPFLFSFGLTISTGCLLWFPFRRNRQELRTRDGFVIVVLFWLLLALSSALPFMLSENAHLTFTDAFFDAMSAVTTTGASTLTGLDELPHSFLYYRHQLQLIGGMSIIVLAMAILPMLGVGGMQLYRAETSSPIKDDKLTPRITETARMIWVIYLALNGACTLAYWAFGMDFFDAVCYSFSTVSTGGLAPHDVSLGYYASAWIKWVAIIFMILGALNFNLHYFLFHQKKLSVYWQDPESRFFLKMMVFMFAVVYAVQFIVLKLPTENILDTFFTVVSLNTTTGLTTVTLEMFPLSVSILLLFGAVMGGCAGSTAGGLKAIRVYLLQKQGQREIQRLIHPHANYLIKIGNKEVPAKVIEAVWGFLAVFIALFTLLLLLLLATEQDLLTAYSSLLASISGAGVGMGKASVDYQALQDSSKWILSFAMLAGRLEIFTLLVLCSPTFWRN